MFRQGLRRCALRAASTASASMVLRSPAMGLARHQMATTIRPISSLKSFLPASRSYSTEAPAEQSDVPAPSAAAAPEPVSLFRDLAERGVHQNLLSAIINGMGYESMTPVQAKTIVPALKGTDM